MNSVDTNEMIGGFDFEIEWDSQLALINIEKLIDVNVNSKYNSNNYGQQTNPVAEGEE